MVFEDFTLTVVGSIFLSIVITLVGFGVLIKAKYWFPFEIDEDKTVRLYLVQGLILFVSAFVGSIIYEALAPTINNILYPPQKIEI